VKYEPFEIEYMDSVFLSIKKAIQEKIEKEIQAQKIIEDEKIKWSMKNLKNI